MLTENEKTICYNLIKYIKFDLSDFIDSEIFTKSTILELGEFYFNKAVNSVEGADERLLKIVIKSDQNDEEICMLDDFYLSLCKIIGIKELPKDRLFVIQEEYEKIFDQRYRAVINKADVKINLINNQMLSKKDK